MVDVMRRSGHNVMHKNIDFLVDSQEQMALSNLSTFKKANVVRIRGFLMHQRATEAVSLL